MPLSGLRIGAVADRVVVQEGGSRWQADRASTCSRSKAIRPTARSSVDRAHARGAPRHRANDWFDRGMRSRTATRGARSTPTATRSQPIRRCSTRTSTSGWLLHEAGRFDGGRAGRTATRITACGSEPLLLYNLGVLLDDMDRKDEAIDAYERRCAREPGLRRLPLQPRASLRGARTAARGDPAHGAVPQAHRVAARMTKMKGKK